MKTRVPAKPTRGRPTGSFTQHRRVDLMVKALDAHPAGLSLDDLAATLRVSRRSVRRYLEELRPMLEFTSAPEGEKLWRIKLSERSRSVSLRRTQAHALLATRRLFEVLRGSALYDEIDAAFRTLETFAKRPPRAGARSEIPSDLRLEERFAVVGPADTNYASRGEDVDKLFFAVAELREIRYRPKARVAPPPAPDPPPDDPIVARPVALVVDRGAIKCLVLAEPESDPPRVLALDDMREIALGETGRYAVPPDFDLKAHVDGVFGMTTPAPRTRVLVEFDPRSADRVRTRRFHPSQRIATASDGRIRLSFDVTDLDEVRSWVMGFGGGARVIEPPALVEAITTSLREALARYH